MFCHNCGNQLPEESKFCGKCGTQVVNADAIQQSPDTSEQAVETVAANTATPVQTAARENAPIDNQEFREYVDNNVRTTTAFKSADDLLKNSKPFNILWKWVGIPALVSVLFTFVGFSVPALFGIGGIIFLYALIALFVLPANERGKIQKSHPFNADVNLDELINFLNMNLKYLSPAFDGWEPSDDHPNKSSTLLTLVSKLTNISYQTARCRFQGKKVHVVVSFMVSTTEEKGEEKQYTIFARKDESGIFYIILNILKILANNNGSSNAGFAEYNCIYKAAPIVTAAVEYYLKTTGSQDAV